MNKEYEMTYRWECIYKMEGVRISAKNHYDLVKQLRGFAFDKPKNNKLHREVSKKWFWEMDRVTIDISTDTTFINEMIRFGYIKVLQCYQKSLKTN